MKNIQLLDCTLRDGGYVNNWEFGEVAINDIVSKLEDSHIDIIELGFLKNEPEDPNRTVFNSVEQINPFIKQKRKGISYAAMIDVQGRIPSEMILPKTLETIDIIRVIIWKKTIDDDFKYCEQIINKGYKLCVQPARVDQYSDSEFISMLKLFEKLNPQAIYIVDSWGTQTIESLMHYMNLADNTLNPEIALGYHGHNNLQQTFGAAESFINRKMTRDKIIDASIYGIGRGAGNLNTEIVALLLNKTTDSNYGYAPLIEIFDKYINTIYKKTPWGYSIPLFLTALQNCNPEYGLYCDKAGLNNMQIMSVLSMLKNEDKIKYDQQLIQSIVTQVIMEKKVNG